MSRTDLIADNFTMIRNAVMARKDSLDVPFSRMTKEILEILKNEAYIDTYKVLEEQQCLRVYLKYLAGKPAIRNIKRISTPGVRVYVKHAKVPRVLRGRGLAIISTPKGVVTDKVAREQRLGGEVIGYVW